MSAVQQEFTLPVQHEDLLVEDDDKYFVETQTKVAGMTPDAIDTLLDEISERLHQSKGTESLSEGPLAIFEHENFDTLWSLVKQTAHLHAEAKVPLFAVLVNGIRGVTAAVPELFSEDVTNDDEYKYELRRHRNALKMYILLIQWLISQEEAAFVRKQQAKVPVKAAKRTGKKKAEQQGDGMQVEEEKGSPWELDSERDKVLNVLYQALLLDLGRLWNQTLPEEQFVQLYSKIAFLLLENTANTKHKGIKSMLSKIVVTLVTKYHITENATALMMNMLGRQPEQIVTILADLTEQCAKDKSNTGTTQFVWDLVRQIGKLKPAELVHNTAGAKNYAAFVVELAERLPKLMLAHVALIKPHLDYESPTMRMGVIQAFGHLVHMGFTTAVQRQEQPDVPGEDPEARETREANDLQNQTGAAHTRDDLLDVLLERFHDIWHHARSRVLQTWSYLAEHKAIPKKYFQHVCEEAVGRLSDKTTNVRKNAIQLLTHLLENNPIGPELPLTNFKRNFATVKKSLEESTKQTWEALSEAQDNPESDLYQGLSGEDMKQLKQASYYYDAIQFLEIVHQSIPLVCELLGSKNLSDVQEAIRFFVVANSFKIEAALLGIRKMLVLVWAKEGNIREEVITAYTNLYLTAPSNLSSNSKSLWIARKLIILALDANLGELTSLEELLTILKIRERISDQVVRVLWAIFSQRTKQGDPRREGRGALMVLTMLGNADPNIIRNKLNLVVNVGLGPKSIADAALAKWSPIALQKLALKEARQVEASAPTAAATAKEGESAAKPQTSQATMRYDASHAVFSRLERVIRNDTLPTSVWFGAAEAAINTIYSIAEGPDAVLEGIIRQMSKPVSEEFKSVADEALDMGGDAAHAGDEDDIQIDDDGADKNQADAPAQGADAAQPAAGGIPHGKTPQGRIARLFFVVGHTALKQLVYLEEIRRDMKHAEEAHGKKKGKAPKAKKTAKKTERGKKDDSDNEEEEDDREAIEKELGVTVAEGAEDEALRKKIEKDIVQGDLLGMFGQAIVGVCTNANQTYNDPHLRAAAVSALFKYMLVSPDFCDENLQLLFTVFQSKETTSIRANIAIALGDMASRFPFVVDPWLSHFYARLRDDAIVVRKNTLMVLTHLILNDMIKARGQISEMAMCLEDPEQRISDLARLFFHELSLKANAIYHIIPDIVSGLSASRGADFESVKNVIRYLLSFIDKDKQLESLVEKLCNRFPTSSDAKQKQYIAYCLSVLNWNERSVKKLDELFKLYKEALQDKGAHEYFIQIIAKARKLPKMAAETKTVLDELEKKVLAIHDFTSAPDDAEQAAGEEGEESTAEPAAKPKAKPKRTSAKRGAAKKAGGRRKKGFDSDSDEPPSEPSSDDERMELGSDDEDKPAKRAPKRAAAKRTAAAAATRPAESDSEEEAGGGKAVEISDGDESEEEKPAKKAAKRGSAKKSGGKASGAKKAGRGKAKKAADSDDDVMELSDDSEEKPAKPAKKAAKKAGAKGKRRKIEESDEDDAGSDDE